MDKPINERFIRITSRIPIAGDIHIGDDIPINIQGINYILNCVKLEQEDTQEGSINVIYKLKSLSE